MTSPIGLLMLLLYPGLALLSAGGTRVLQPAKLRDALWTHRNPWCQDTSADTNVVQDAKGTTKGPL